MASSPRRLIGDSLPRIGRPYSGLGRSLDRHCLVDATDTRHMEIRSFRGYRYAGSAERDVSAVVAPPYDQISPETQDRLYAMSPHNIVRVTYPKDAADKYPDARAALDGWLAGFVWAREERAAIYPYHQTYTVDGRPVTRTGFVALGEVSAYARGVVLPHERTHAGPKRDRMQLLEATAADIGLL